MQLRGVQATLMIIFENIKSIREKKIRITDKHKAYLSVV